MKENSFEYNDKEPNKEDNEQILVYDLVGDKALRYMVKDELTSSDLTIDVKKCKTAKEVFSQLSKMSNTFDKKENDNNRLWLKDSNKKIFWLKVDDKLYIKFDSFIQLDGDLLSSMQYRINDDNEKEDKTRLPVVFFDEDEDCIRLQLNNLIKDKNKFVYTEDDSKNFHFHKNNSAKNIRKLSLYEKEKSLFRTKDNESINTLYRTTNTFLLNIGNAYYYRPLYLPVSLCGINVMKDTFSGPSCLCGVGCCSPYGMIDEKETKDLEQNIFPLFNLKDANNESKENISKQ